ncbi:MAG: hypothetical protein OEQ13_09005, partial [Acidobacteriota bacterium]|nr:hypothetical protein [Acidobacteriota bacterium]
VSVFSRWSNREPVTNAPELRDTETLGLGAAWTAALARQWALKFDAQRIDQKSDLAGDPRVSEYTTYGAGVQWKPRESRR